MRIVLTNLTIVDKFGQAIACPLPAPAPRTPPAVPAFPIHPCLADQLCPTLLSDNTLNTVFTNNDALTTSGMVHSPFIQITPAINQSARINASFLKRNFDDNGAALTPPWTVCNDWDNPIIGCKYSPFHKNRCLWLTYLARDYCELCGFVASILHWRGHLLYISSIWWTNRDSNSTAMGSIRITATRRSRQACLTTIN